MELQERLDLDVQQNHRVAHLLTMHAGTNHGYKANQDQKFPSKSCVLRYGKEKVALDAFRLFERGLNDYLAQSSVSPKKKGGSSAWAITSLFIGASNIWATPAGMNPITHFFSSPTSSPPTSSLQAKAGPSSPSSSSGIWSLDAPLPQYKTPDMDDEITCELDLDLDEPANDVRFDASTKDLQENDIICTPTFGQFRHVNNLACALQLPAPGSGVTEVGSPSASPNVPNLDPGHNTLETRAFIINCSPIEQEKAGPIGCATACKDENYKESLENRDKTQICNVLQLSHATEDGAMDIGGSESLSAGTLRREPQSCSTSTGSHPQVSKVLKLKDMWDRKESSCSGSIPKDNWVYKQEEIDEAVLSELPAEIQAELRRSMGCKRPRMVKKSTIGDFFSNSSERGNKSDS